MIGSSEHVWVRICVAVCILWAAGWNVGCTHEVQPGEREESFRPFSSERVGDLSLNDYLAQRTALLIEGAVPVRVGKTADGWDIRLAEVPRRNEIGLGSAIALSTDGTFLTAAHNLQRPPFAVAVIRKDRIEFSEAKIVWRGNADIPEEDFAVIKASVRPEGVVQWKDDDRPGPATEIASMSAPHGRCGGRILESAEYSSPTTPCTVRTVLHDLPILVGDSGGPVVGRDGRLVGMNVLIKGSLFGAARSLAIRPSWRWASSFAGGSR